MAYNEIILWSLRASNEDGYTLSRYYRPPPGHAAQTARSEPHGQPTTSRHSSGKAMETIQISSAATCMIQLTRQSITHFRVLRLSLAQLQSLRILRLNNNCLTQLSPSIFDLSGLEELDLSYNQLRRLPPGISRLKRLDNLKLHHNQLEHLPQELAHLADLYTLDVSSNRLSSLPAELHQRPQLTRFWFENNLFTEPPPAPAAPAAATINTTGTGCNDAANSDDDAIPLITSDDRCPRWLRLCQTIIDPQHAATMIDDDNDNADDDEWDISTHDTLAEHAWWPGLSVAFEQHQLPRQKRKIRGTYRVPFEVQAGNYGLRAQCLQLLGEQLASTQSNQEAAAAVALCRLPLRLREQLHPSEASTPSDSVDAATCWQCHARLYHGTLGIVIWQRMRRVFVPWQLRFCRLACLLKVHGALCAMLRVDRRVRIQLLLR